MSEKPKFKKLRQVTLPVLKIEKNTERYFKFIGPMHKGEKIDDQKDPATVIHSIDLETGEEGLVIVPAIMEKELQKQYERDSYVGRCFSVVLTRVPEKRYNIVTLCEVAEPEAPDSGAEVVSISGGDVGQMPAAVVAAAGASKASKR